MELLLFWSKKNKAEVWGIELMENEAKITETVLDKIFMGSCESHLNKLPKFYFDVIYFNDVLELLSDPYSVLELLKSKLSPEEVIINSIPKRSTL